MNRSTGQGILQPLSALLFATCALGLTLSAQASSGKLSTSATYWGGFEYQGGDTAINRVSIQSQYKKRWKRRLQLDIAGSIDWARDAAGLGSTENYAPLTLPFLRTDHVRGQIDRATLRYRHKNYSVTLGKQVLAWGVLDGLRVADRADPVRRRDFILAERRPERLGRWGIRTRTKLGSTGIDVAAFFDNTVDQAPSLGSAFFPTAARSLGGFDAHGLTNVGEPQVAKRSHGLSQTTWAMKLAQRFGSYDAQFIALYGPDTEPLIAPVSATDIELHYPTRALVALTLQRSLGATVVRFESAYIPNQSINTAQNGHSAKVGRFLAGIGVDFRVAGGWFINTQLGLDQLENYSLRYGRPRTDLIATLRAQNNFVQDRLAVKAELIGSVTDKDGYLGVSTAWQFNDSLKASVGTDIMFGDNDELFGQFENRSRAWIRLTYTP